MSRVRGGVNSTEIRISSHAVCAFIDRIDLLIPLNDKSLERLSARLTSKTLIVGDSKTLGDNNKVIDIPFLEKAKEIGSSIYANIMASCFVLGLLNIPRDMIEHFLTTYFSDKGKEIIDNNVQAAKIGWDIGREKCKELGISFQISRHDEIVNQLLINGSQAISLGAIAGGCNFVSAYPMSPSTGVLTFLAQQAETFGIVVEQAEDEISAINMGIGSWYAGGRALTTTSGGGFALMTEGLSLAGCIESPMVIHLAQRPGPATGLPTRTEQGDLEFALYGGHGEFPRVIFTPGTIQDAFLCAHKAFEIADTYQVPVIILTDQFLLDSFYNMAEFPNIPDEVTHHIVKTSHSYKRYQRSENDVSERGIPGYGDGLVCLDSDEHDENGHITEDFDTNVSDIAWCPGCGNFGILKIIKEVLTELSSTPQQTVLVSGIGQAAKIPQYINAHFFNGLHGRALPPATAIKASNPNLTVIAESGDGDMYGEGGNHFIHCIRRNPNITNIVHNNMVYGLTKGQASPTSERGFQTPVQVNGVMLEPINPIAVAISLDASFVARVFVGEKACI
ncbi:MAG: hypothetical protein EOM20_04575 [Spartobacteria bacterium]|nr:hypothetical protein [Spartobacteria bacterium]